tara:strand:+ start:3756 stop:4814 length:1059 start_codon:yes stop_codon:yes gene_type:complete
MIKIITIVGARPQFIKHAPLSIKLNESFIHKSIHTGQHYDSNMSELFFDDLGIKKPDYFLKEIHKFKTHGTQTAEMLSQIEEILIEEKPDFVLVYGDTNSTLAGALAAIKLNIKIVHVEAGLRSYNNNMPEEINRILTDRISSLLFCSTELGRNNLLNESNKGDIFICGDIMKDSLSLVSSSLRRDINFDYILATIHRPYNTDNKKRICSVLKMLNHLDDKVIFPIHPRTNKLLDKFKINKEQFTNIIFIEPSGYKEFISLLNFCNAIITDSGGIQKEAYMLQKKCITLRSETEWTETLKGFWNELVFEDLDEVSIALARKPIESEYDNDVYGIGSVSDNIVEQIKLFFNKQ